MATKMSHNPFDLDAAESSTAQDDNPPSYTESQTFPTIQQPPTIQGNHSHPKLIAIPALPLSPSHDTTAAAATTTNNPTTPFLRAYPPTLRTTHSLPITTFTTFLDTLNASITNPNTSLQALDATGNILLSIPIVFPLHWVGSVVSGAANAGERGVTRSRRDNVLRRANREVFRPRGLEGRIVSVDVLAGWAGLPVLDSWGRVSGDDDVLRRVLGVGLSSVGVDEVDTAQRWMRVLTPWVEDVVVDVLPCADGERTRLGRFNAALRRRNRLESQSAGRALGSSGSAQLERDGMEAFRRSVWLVFKEVGGGEG